MWYPSLGKFVIRTQLIKCSRDVLGTESYFREGRRLYCTTGSNVLAIGSLLPGTPLPVVPQAITSS
jgi:hypothetical protein